MKLLLTSAGIRNQAIADTLVELLGKPTADSNILFIPTAMNAEDGDKHWVINELSRLSQLGWRQFDMLDVSGLSPDRLRTRVEEADVIYMNGGDTFYLMNQLNKSGFAKILQEVKDKKVYVGSSAGSIVSSKAFPAGGELFSDSKSVDWPDTKESLGWLDAYPVPHYKGEDFPERTDEWLDERSDNLGFKVFALGDGSALKVIDDAVEVVGEGPWKMI